jgi:hypothetical protein
LSTLKQGDFYWLRHCITVVEEYSIAASGEKRNFKNFLPESGLFPAVTNSDEKIVGGMIFFRRDYNHDNCVGYCHRAVFIKRLASTSPYAVDVILRTARNCTFI